MNIDKVPTMLNSKIAKCKKEGREVGTSQDYNIRALRNSHLKIPQMIKRQRLSSDPTYTNESIMLNCRGLGKPQIVSNVQHILRGCQPSLVFLSETKLTSSEMKSFVKNLDDFYGVLLIVEAKLEAYLYYGESMWQSHSYLAPLSTLMFQLVGNKG